MTAASVLPYTDDVGRSVSNALLQIASWDSLRPHIPILAWNWLKKRPTLRPRCLGLIFGIQDAVIRAIVELGDVGLVTSYLFVIWSEWNHAYSSRFFGNDSIDQGGALRDWGVRMPCGSDPATGLRRVAVGLGVGIYPLP